VIVLDTNVISELMRPEPDGTVLAWVAAQPRAQFYTTHFNQAEMLYGIAALPAGRRRTTLADLAETMFAEDFRDRILPFNAAAAARYAEIAVERRRSGNPIGIIDALIAATALAAGASVATRDIGGFEGCGLTVINPWTVGPP
jgi:predicted nucleic acid-binding protein